jgi:small-conductance mechanosensitive channel
VIDGLLAQVGIWKARTDKAPILDAARACETELQNMRSALIDVNMKGSQLWPSGLHEKFNALLDSADGADYAPPQQARDVFDELAHQLKEITERLNQVHNEEIATLNSAIEQAGLPIVGVT